MATLTKQARRAAQLRYQPEKDQLAELLLQARENLVTGLLHSKGATAGVVRSLQAARPQMEKVYRDAGMSYGGARSALAADMAKISQGAGAAAGAPYAAAAAREAAGARRRLASAATSAVNELTSRTTDARAGQVFQEQNLRSQYNREAAQIGVRASKLAGEQGQYAAQTLDQLKAAAAKQAKEERALEERARHDRATEGIQRTSAGERARHDRQTEANARRKAGGRKGKPAYTPTQKRGFVDDVTKAVALGQEARRRGIGPAQIRHHLLTGPGPTFGRWETNAAMDVVVHGHLRGSNAHYWRRHGIRIPRRWRPPIIDLSGKLPL